MQEFNKQFEKIVYDLMDKGIILRISRDSPRVSVVDVKLNNEKPIEVLIDAINTLNQYNTSDCVLYYEAGSLLDREFGGFSKETLDEFYRKG